MLDNMSFNAKKYDKIYNDRSKEVEFLLEHLKGKTVLDIGGGTGAISEALNERGFECWNIEPQEEMAEISRNRKINTSQNSIESFNFDMFHIHPDDNGRIYDNAIMMFDVFNFLEDPNRALQNILKLLDGRLIFSYWNSEVKKSGWEFNWKLKRLSHKRWRGNRVKIDFWFPFYHEKHFLKIYPDRYIYRILHKAGFKVINKFDNYYTKTVICELLM